MLINCGDVIRKCFKWYIVIKISVFWEFLKELVIIILMCFILDCLDEKGSVIDGLFNI